MRKFLIILNSDLGDFSDFDIIDQFLADAGTDKSQILSVTIYLKNIEQDYAAFNEVWDAWVADIDALPRTCVEAKLYDPRVLVELTVVAVQPA